MMPMTRPTSQPNKKFAKNKRPNHWQVTKKRPRRHHCWAELPVAMLSCKVLWWDVRPGSAEQQSAEVFVAAGKLELIGCSFPATVVYCTPVQFTSLQRTSRQFVFPHFPAPPAAQSPLQGTGGGNWNWSLPRLLQPAGPGRAAGSRNWNFMQPSVVAGQESQT